MAADLDLVRAVVKAAMVEMAERDQVVEIRPPALCSMNDVVGVKSPMWVAVYTGSAYEHTFRKLSTP
jgi:hypothetical protein